MYITLPSTKVMASSVSTASVLDCTGSLPVAVMLISTPEMARLQVHW